MSNLDSLIQDLVIANRILAREEVVEAFEDGQDAADPEDRERHDERIEVSVAGVAEGMPQVRGSNGASGADEQEDLVHRVRD